ncbi:helix-turn-helix domain-containing protein [Aporhodopirellula aestuarii]|uniref:Helix-turn-helix domain-containing protein n=1 Tax=Aporhodopirellula aestuarii TaxID=2950107 RepID=A0ABT0U398_9BACT|nr:helix-turn-helix domain-containing protein [Aporhodopirellula aestuarii]MCM2371337.1 helix-turn-helix domain-containing protein [Aporhodopirellula aestuarii]
MATYLSLEEAAKQLGIPTQSLIDLRSQGQVRGFRDGSSWKFPESEIARLREELPNLSGFGSGVLGADGPGSKVGKVIGGDGSGIELDEINLDADGSGGSSIELGMEGSSSGSDSDVNLIAGDGSGGSDVLIIPGGEGGSSIGSGSGSGSSLPIDLDELDLAGSAISHDSGELNLAAKEAAAAGKKPAPTAGSAQDSDEFNLGSVLDLEGDDDSPALEIEGGSSSSVGKGAGPGSDDISGVDVAAPDSGDVLLGSDSDIDFGMVGNDEKASSLEMMEDLDLQDSASGVGGVGKVSGDVLSELDLLAGDSVGSGLLSGDSENLLGSSLLGADEGGSSGVDDALADDDDLVISDDDDDLIVSSAGSDISIAGDSGINLMSPSDSGLSLESEPLDLAGSSISALDLGAELVEGSGSGSGSGSSGYGSGLIPEDGSGANLDFPSDEEFQLSPSGIQLEASDESESQEIDVENSDSFGSGGFDEPAFVEEAVVQDAEVFGEEGGDVFGGVEGIDEGVEHAEEPFTPDDSAYERPAAAAVGGVAGYEIPFTLLQTVGLMLILMVMSLGGMLMTDLVRNMWSYTEPAAPVSSLTDMLIDVAGWGK